MNSLGRIIRGPFQERICHLWHAAPPADLGQVSHGKLKADEWRSCFEFDIPVSLLRIATQQIASGRPTDEHRAKLVHSTFLLATAIRWATSHRTSTMHIEKYTNTEEFPQNVEGPPSKRAFPPQPRQRPAHRRLSSSIWPCSGMVDVPIRKGHRRPALEHEQ
jgi:hypothetical protein